MKRFVIRIFVFLVVLYVVTTVFSWWLDSYFREDFIETKSNWILRQKNKHVDFAVVGSSRVYNMIDIKKMETASGRTGINLGTSGSGYPENYLILERFSRSNKIDHVVINVDLYSFNSKKSFSYSFHDFEFLPLFSDDSVNRVFKDVEGFKYFLWSIVPVSKYIEFNNRFSLFSFRKKKFEFYKLLDDSRGYRPRREEGAKTIPDTTRQNPKGREEINAMDWKYFGKILDLCEKRHMRVVLVTTPSQRSSEQVNQVGQLVRRAAEKYNVKYFHFSQIGDFSDPEYFDDPTHTSSQGTLYYSQRLAEALKAADEI